jgi:hypothetical protein
METRSLAADYNNGAGILPQSYYTKRTCRDLLKLAAFTILAGHLFNPSGVGGLDILVAENKQPPRFIANTSTPIKRVIVLIGV